jgi:hypothetical protein
MQRLDVLLLNGLFQDESNVRLARCRANRLSVVAVVLLTPHEGLHILRAYDLHLMPKRFELARPVECSRAGFNDNGAAFDLRHRIPDVVREQIIKLALDEPTLSPRELAVRFTDTENYLVSEASVYRLPKAHDLIASPAFIVMKAADACQTILIERERIKRQTIVNRRLMHRRQAA